MDRKSLSGWALVVGLAVFAAACGDTSKSATGCTNDAQCLNGYSCLNGQCEPTTVQKYNVGGTVSGLVGGATVVLQNNGGDNLSLATNGTFHFVTPAAGGAAYSVTILTQPATELCTVAGGAGGVTNTDVSSVTVSCIRQFTVGGTVTGLTGTVVIQNNGVDNLYLSADGPFSFTTPLASGANYDVSVLIQPNNQNCTVTYGTAVANANVATVTVTCAGVNVFAIGGTLAGLGGGTLVLQDNSADNLSLTGNGMFMFPISLEGGASYAVTVLTQPTNQTCTVTSGSGTVAATVTTVSINCVCSGNCDISGSVSGLTASGLVLQNNGGDDLTVNAGATTFTFATPVPVGNSYSVTVLTQPTGQVCTVTNATGGVSSSVTNVVVSCGYVVGGTVAGLLSGETIVLQNNGGDNLSLTANGAFAFLTGLAFGAGYNVTVLTQPTTQSCTITGSTGNIAGGVGNVVVKCALVYVYVTNGGANTVSQYIVSSTGALTPMTPAAVATGASPVGVAMDESGHYVYVSNEVDNTISQYTVGPTGALSPMTTPTVATGVRPRGVVIDPLGRYAYVANYATASSTISQYTVGPTGALSSMTIPTVAAGLNPQYLVMDPLGRYVYVSNEGDNTISQYTVTGSGGLSAMGPAVVATYMTPEGLSIDPTGRYVYVTNRNGNAVTQYTVGLSGGGLSPMTPVAIPIMHPSCVASHPSGSYVYVGGFTTQNVVAPYTIGNTGGLTAMTAVAGVASGVTSEPGGRYVYASTNGANTISQYTVGPDGVLTPMSPATVATGQFPTVITSGRGW